MTPIEAAVKAAHEANIIQWHPGDFEDCVMASDIAPIITAFLEAAAGDEHVCLDVGAAAIDSHQNTDYLGDNGKAAILALKETING